ncbi:hypothetical protein [Actinophytocola sp.]|uniref:hypothetical protein n=1 Tax=Actinophytocola sp. TaxID=1872138 RepID=UPI002D7F7FB0|nr:hypothetical protein [Actinophytocola sp.]HET9142653.1 hypothetical protein [Actinophytocola sp.]HEU5108357.1 hypothetical protein [Micromonosporaceae bacterium]
MVRLVVLFVALVALSGCASRLAGTPTPNEQAAREATEPLTSARGLGDLPTLDYCSLTDPKALPDSVGPVAVAPRGSYDYCRFGLQKNGTDIEVRVGYLEDAETLDGVDRTGDLRRDPPRGLKVERGKEEDDYCVRFVSFTDEVALTVLAESLEGTGENLCAVADAAVDVMIDRVLAKKVAHLTFTDRSVGRLDPCEVVTAEQAATAIGTPGATPLAYPSGHLCEWAGPDSESTVARLYLTPGLSSYDVETTKEETFAGRHTMTTATSVESQDLAMCQVETDDAGETKGAIDEFVLIEVLVLGKGKDACGPARALAEQVWPKLPG